MFSEYASRFLAQSQSRLSSFGQQDNHDESNQRNAQWSSRHARGTGRPFFQRGGLAAGNPYQPSGSRFGNLAFASRYSSAPHEAPLFHSALDEFREEDEEERDREAADLFALQHSRRVFAAGRLEESTEDENDASRASLERSRGDGSRSFEGRTRGMGIRSSWNGTRSFSRQDRKPQFGLDKNVGDRKASQGSDGSKDKMVDIGLESQIEDDDPPAELLEEASIDNSPPAFQRFKTPAAPSRFQNRRDSTQDSEFGLPKPSETETEDEQPVPRPSPPAEELFKHDPFFAWIFLIALAALLATFILVWLHTSTPGKKKWGDTIYTTLQSSFHLLAVDTLVSIVVALVWLAALRSFVRPLVFLICIALPVILVSFSLYPFISSYKGRDHGKSLQDSVMRWASVLPAVSAGVWVYLVYKGRYALRAAIEILEFSSRILAANSALVLVGMSSLALVVLWTWAWIAMFTRVFLGGYFATGLGRFIISVSSWWLGAYFVLMYIWTLSVLSGVQRGTTAATVSQWYFHRNAQAAPASRDVVLAAFGHAVSTIFGVICLSTLLAVVIRLPLLVLPRRLANIVGMFAYSFVPSPIVALTNPLTLTYSAIHSQNLAMSARGLSQMDFLMPGAPTTTLTPRAFHRRSGTAPLLPYRLAKLLLHATRFIMTTALGFAGWVLTARQLRVLVPDGSAGFRGSAYAYVVGLVAGFIGWGVLGAMEGILSGIVDAVVICYGSEKGMANGGYCMEAAYLFGDRERRDDQRDEY